MCTLAGHHQRTVYSAAWRDPAVHANAASTAADTVAAAGPALIATGAGDDCIRVFRESEGSSAQSDSPSFDLELTAAAAHAGDVNCVAWAPAQNGLLLASAGDDCLVKIWQYEPA